MNKIIGLMLLFSYGVVGGMKLTIWLFREGVKVCYTDGSCIALHQPLKNESAE